jgi:hypothetical protein
MQPKREADPANDPTALVAADVLSAAMVGAGRRLLHRLDQLGLPAPVALWVFFPGRRTWRMVIAAPGVRRSNGEASSAPDIERAAHGAAGAVDPRPIVLDLDHPFVALVRRGAPPGSRFRERRVHDLMVDGVRIPDLYVYRV